MGTLALYLDSKQPRRVVVKMWNPDNGFKATINAPSEVEAIKHMAYFTKRGYVPVAPSKQK